VHSRTTRLVLKEAGFKITNVEAILEKQLISSISS